MNLKTILYIIFSTIVSIELFSAIGVSMKMIDAPDMPTYFTYCTQRDTAFIDVPKMLGPRNIDTSLPWCTWHPVNASTRQIEGDCIDATMKFNAIGARGVLPDQQDTSTVVFLGDSFIEGYGLQENETIPFQYATSARKPVLNLGTSGKFGTTQMSVVYEYLGKQFAHNKVVICTYLANDFNDNNPDCHLSGRYAPYYVPDTAGGYKLITKGSAENSSFTRKSYDEMIQRGYTHVNVSQSALLFLSNSNNAKDAVKRFFQLSYTYRLFKHIESRINPKYPEYSNQDLAVFKYTIQRIIDTAATRNAKVYLVNIPEKAMWNSQAYLDFNRKRQGDMTATLKGSNITILDFAGYVSARKIPPVSLYHSCNAHFNAYGAQVFSSFLAENIH